MTAYEIFMTILVLVMCVEYVYSSLKYKKLANNYEKIADKYQELWVKHRDLHYLYQSSGWRRTPEEKRRLIEIIASFPDCKLPGEDNDKTDSSH